MDASIMVLDKAIFLPAACRLGNEAIETLAAKVR